MSSQFANTAQKYHVTYVRRSRHARRAREESFSGLRITPAYRFPRAERSKPSTMAKVIAFANQKGGVAKTTTTLNLAVAFAEQGNRVLCCDMDPQGNLTMSQ